MMVGCPPGTPPPSTASSPTTPGSRPTRNGDPRLGQPPARPRETRPTCLRRPNSSRDGRSPGPTSSWRCPARSRFRPRARCLTSSSRSTRRSRVTSGSGPRKSGRGTRRSSTTSSSSSCPPASRRSTRPAATSSPPMPPECPPASCPRAWRSASRPDRGSSSSSTTPPGGRSRSTGAGSASSSPTRRRSTKN